MNIVLDVQGMSCGHCVKSITAAVTPLAGVTSVDVDLAAKKVTVTGNADPGVVAAAIEDCGYDVSSTVSA
ncbi:cation transporter [Mycolicibacterium bacteremicum]|uniref:Heavy metal transporter n=1 Tax=Mycolicibacterium bacteremicum TaxID=564198 RepID=A0A1W9YU07_MYCBA|nr:cation transporter [Mycolicibacterium bacteremicum]MCV7431142.1 heavy-metal-associated domain-containing protein [Mycolicibacterium bacteremicum]ORA03479.1 heavy metal transporter [Mycolicibacterium bacteremicum]